MKMLESLLSNFFLSLNISQLQLASIDLIKLIYISDVEAEAVAQSGVNILFVFAHIWDGKILKVLHGSVEGYSNFNITLMYKS